MVPVARLLVVMLLLIAASVRLPAAPSPSFSFESFGFPGSTLTSPWGINDRGQIVGHYVSGGTQHGFFLDDGFFTTIDVPGSSFTNARGINNRGDIVGRYASQNIDGIFLLSHGEFTTITLPLTSPDPRGLNDRGDIVGVHSSNLGFLAGRDGVTTVAYPGALSTAANGVNNRRDVVGEYNLGGGTRGFLWMDGAFTTIHYPGAFFTRAFGINDAGDIAGYYVDQQSTIHGFALKRGEFIRIDLDFPKIDPIVFGINNRGQIVGSHRISPRQLNPGFGFVGNP